MCVCVCEIVIILEWEKYRGREGGRKYINSFIFLKLQVPGIAQLALSGFLLHIPVQE